MTRESQLRSGGTEAEWARFEQTMTDVRACFADLPPDDIEDLISQALIDARRSGREAFSLQDDEET